MMVRSTRARPFAKAALAAATALMLSGCLDSVQRPSVVANVNAAPDLPGGGSEDFVVNVGRRTYFREAATDLDSVAKDTLDKQAEWLKRYPRWKVKIQGFADDPGSKEANVSVSTKRAQSVRAYLVAQGVSPDRIYAKGYGRERLVRDCADLSCKSQNRRVITNLEGDRDL
ncbi:OmpA family protein [uncultured Enterovirga sp.]|uniref:OmpA family protein n=1 Tax=uncultured Enterovirga sp. TaxID=2026352 RepID=UPI0035CAA9FA